MISISKKIKMPFCEVCEVSVNRRHWIGHLRSTDHKNKGISSFSDGVEIINSAFRCRIASYRIAANSDNQNSVERFYESIKKKLNI